MLFRSKRQLRGLGGQRSLPLHLEFEEAARRLGLALLLSGLATSGAIAGNDFRFGSIADVVTRTKSRTSLGEKRDQGFRIIFFAILSATVRSESGMNGLLLQPGRDEEGLRSPGSHRVTGWAAISLSSRAASSSRVSPSNTRLLAFRTG